MPINTRFAYRRPATEGAAALQRRRRRPSTRLHALGNALLSLSLLPLSFTHYVRPRDIRGHEQRCTGYSKSNSLPKTYFLSKKRGAVSSFRFREFFANFFPQFDFLEQNIGIVVKKLLTANMMGFFWQIKFQKGKKCVRILIKSYRAGQDQWERR